VDVGTVTVKRYKVIVQDCDGNWYTYAVEAHDELCAVFLAGSEYRDWTDDIAKVIVEPLSDGQS